MTSNILSKGVEKSPRIALITLSSGDCGLIFNERVIMTADPDFEPVDQVETVAFNLANALPCDINVFTMPVPPKEDWNWSDVLSLHLRPDLKLYRVAYHEEVGNKAILQFDCFASDPEHAIEQAEDAYPGSEILFAAEFVATDDCYLWTIREALEQSRAALPDQAFARQYSVQPDLICRINSALDDVSDDEHLLRLLTEARIALPLAWKNQGGCDLKLLRSIDLVLQSNVLPIRESVIVE
ncbi:MAG: hypothetical protein Q7U98_03445 [Methylicorpusculum sp.]|uniref:hypothetical protein n=1 Tax=Methylicorpusculum sp. TaxID=2713644 RepID=UPI0027214225|nr:hypothetical protein [Methylicorpusculum sp.]MDO8844410.1 hypothetical protein [Methylicorpusculum sp.]MDO8938193.1 hypothetical protein [Methylicorpusculum sp.]MDP2178818.1 hypothetical protein [Methylicorpusculum sp.]MDP3529112.1 hypothetical protein [Methylicorpusculum sp.]